MFDLQALTSMFAIDMKMTTEQFVEDASSNGISRTFQAYTDYDRANKVYLNNKEAVINFLKSLSDDVVGFLHHSIKYRCFNVSSSIEEDKAHIQLLLDNGLTSSNSEDQYFMSELIMLVTKKAALLCDIEFVKAA